ncbi:MAG: sensor histidine kinase [Bacteroidota bacterium]
MKYEENYIDQLTEEKLEELKNENDFLKQQSLKELNERLELAIKGGNIGIWEWMIQSNRIIWNDKMQRMFGMKPGTFDSTYESFIKCIHPDDAPMVEEAIKKTTNENEPLDLTYRTVWPTGEVRHIKTVASVVRDEKNMLVKVLGVCTDLTDVKIAEEKQMIAMKNMKRSNEELEQFAYVASHDLQEPLRMVSSFTQLLEQRYSDKLDDDAKEFIGYAVDGANRMQKLINDLLNYSRITTQGEEFKIVDLSTILGYASSNLYEKILETNTIVTNDELPKINGDESQMVRLFQNLIDNAIKYKGNLSPRIHVSSKLTPGFWQISVKDNGMGIDPQYSERIFQIFQRLHGKEEYSGTGIGLAICKRIVERHGGKIWVESTEGEDSEFFFTIKK